MANELTNFAPIYTEVPDGELVSRMPVEEMVETYQPTYPDMAKQMALLGKKTKEIAEFFGVTSHVLKLWCREYPEFHACLRDGSDLADGRVAQALYQRAVGMEIEEEVVVKLPTGETAIETIKKQVLPDVSAATNWLKSRQSESWRESKKLEVVTEKKKTMADIFADDETEDKDD